MPPLPQPLDNEQRQRIRAALWRNPLDQQLVNYLYVDAVRASGNNSSTLRTAKLLAALGWRYTPAQQNLMLRAAIDQRYVEVVDRADALLRRQKLTEQAMTMLMAMEAIPQVHRLVVDKLVGDPMWRYDYLLRIGPQSLPQVIDARFRTLRMLLQTPSSVSRAEIAPALEALIANGRGRDANALWILKAGPQRGENILRDENFHGAAKLAADDTHIPFEWQMYQNLGYSADVGGQGVIINWDGRGIPVFMSQLVPVEADRSYVLAVEGKADSDSLGKLLSPVLDCRTGKSPFTVLDSSAGVTRFRSTPVPGGCDIATLSIGGNIDAGRRPVSMEIARIVLQPTR